MDLAADEREPRAEFRQCFRGPVGECVSEIAFGDFTGEAEEFKVVGVLCHLLGQFRVRDARWRVKFEGAMPVRSIERFIIMFSRTFRDQPYSTAAAAYQLRSSAVVVRHGIIDENFGTRMRGGQWTAPHPAELAVALI